MKKAVILVSALFIAAIIAVGVIFFPYLSDLFKDDNFDMHSDSAAAMSANNFSVYDSNGCKVQLSDYVGKPIVVNFWATWCGYCVRELPDFQKVYSEYGDKVNFMMVDLADGSREKKSDAMNYVKSMSFTFPVYFDTDFSASNAYSIRSIPMTLIIDKDGNVIKTQNGMMDGNDLKLYLDNLLSE